MTEKPEAASYEAVWRKSRPKERLKGYTLLVPLPAAVHWKPRSSLLTVKKKGRFPLRCEGG